MEVKMVDDALPDVICDGLPPEARQKWEEAMVVAIAGRELLREIMK